MKGEDFSERLIDFAVRIIRLVNALPKTRGAESRADFVHKLAVSWKEMRESCFWLKVIHRAQLKPILLMGIMEEGNQLLVNAMLTQSLKTARRGKT